MVVIQVCVQLPTPANIVTLLAFAAERREAVQMLIDISYLLSSQQQTRHSGTQQSITQNLLHTMQAVTKNTFTKFLAIKATQCFFVTVRAGTVYRKI